MTYTQNPAAAAKNNNKPLTIREKITSKAFRDEIAKQLPKHLTPDRMISVACNQLERNPKLAQCTQASFLYCMHTCTQLGIEPDGRRAHLIPYEDRKRKVTICTLIIDWKGLAELVMRSGIVTSLHADIVRDEDKFTWNKGEIITHEVNWKISRGEPYAAYCIATTKSGATFTEVMPKIDILSIRDGSQGWQSFVNGYTRSNPWNPACQLTELEMWKKTVFRRLSKWLPLSPEFRDALDRDIDPDPDVPDIQKSKTIEVEATVTVQPDPDPQPEPPLAENDEIPMDFAPDSAPAQAAPVVPPPQPKPAAAAPAQPEPPISNIQNELAIFVCEQCGYTFDNFRNWCVSNGHYVKQSADWIGFESVPVDICKKILNAPTGFRNSMKYLLKEVK